MFTIFHLFFLILPVAGAFIGFILGQQHYGLLGGVGGTLLGGASGSGISYLLPVLGLRWMGMGRKSTADLKAILASDQYYIYHLALPHLMARGEDISSAKPRILDLLLSENVNQREHGWGCLQLAFPDAAREISDFSYLETTEAHRNILRAMRDEIQHDR